VMNELHFPCSGFASRLARVVTIRRLAALAVLAAALAGCTSTYTVGKVKDTKLIGVLERNNSAVPFQMKVDPAAKASSGNVLLAQDGQTVYKIDYVNDDQGARLVCDACYRGSLELVDATGRFQTSGEAGNTVLTKPGGDQSFTLFLDRYTLSSEITGSYTSGNMTTTTYRDTYVDTALVTPWDNVEYVKQTTVHDWIGWTLIYPGAIMALVGGILYAVDVEGAGTYFVGGLAITGVAIWQFVDPYTVEEPVYP